MKYNYNILWLDDEPIKALKTIQEANQNVNFEKIDYVDECEAILSSQSEKYHAVILDANGVSSEAPEKDANKSGFISLVQHVIQCKIPLYIYSGQLLRASDGDSADVVLEALHNFGLREGENIFQKSNAPYEMIDKILSDLDSNYLYYKGHEYILDFFSKGWIEKKLKSSQFDPIMRYYMDHDVDSAHGNQMRQIVEQMLECINSILGIVDNKVTTGRSKAIIDSLSYNYKEYSKMMIGALRHMHEMPNEESHNSLDEEMRELYFCSDFSTFFLVTKWFYDLMLLFEKKGYIREFYEKPLKGSNNESSFPNQNEQEQSKPKLNINREGIYVKPYEENGQKYIDVKKVKVLYGNKSLEKKSGRVYVTKINIDKRTHNSWITDKVYIIDETSDKKNDRSNRS